MNRFAQFMQGVVTPLIVLGLAGVIAFDHFRPAPAVRPIPSVDARALGRAYAPSVTASLADAWVAAADALDRGKSVTDAQVVLQDAWKAGRTKAFAERVAPEFRKVLPEGAEPADPAQRSAIAQSWREFAAGLKGGR